MCGSELPLFSRLLMACLAEASHSLACSSNGIRIRCTAGSIGIALKDWLDCKSDPGAGASPLFPPQHPDEEGARQAILNVVRREPRLLGYGQSRWTLKTIAKACDWLRVSTPSGLSQMLNRLKISYKRARDYIHSPDPNYRCKLDLVEICLLRAWYEPERFVFLYQDEFTYYRQPTLAQAYEAKGRKQPLARRSYRSNTQFRVVATLNAITGQVTYQQRSKIRVPTLSNFYAGVRTDYSEAEEIYMVQDNWPVHFHPDLLVRLQPQDFFPEPPRVPANWPTEPRPKATRGDLPIRLLLLPTYASWLNPIEKLWRRLKQDVLHLHRLSDEWQDLRQEVANFLDQFRDGSPELLRYVGLLPN